MRSARSATVAAAMAAVLLAVPGAALADILVLKDGRSIEGVKLEKRDGSFLVRYPHGEITIPEADVKDAFIEQDGVFEPRNEEEMAKLEQGLVPFEGKWVRKDQRDAAVQKRQERKRRQIEELRAHQMWRNRWKSATQNFEFEYTIMPEVYENYAALMEAYFKEFAKDWGIRRPAKLGRLKVCFYHDYESFLQVGGAGRGVLAYYRFVEPLELNFYYDRYNPVETEQVMFHEASHYLQHLIDIDFGYPHCMGEAMAEYYGASRWDPEKKKLTTGLIQEGRLTEVMTDIQGGEMKRLEDYLSGRLGYDDYTWGWTFVHFMMSTPKYSSKFRRFFMALASAKDIKRVPFTAGMKTVEGDEILDSFKRYMGVRDLDALEKEWHSYIKDTLKVSTERGYEEAGNAAWRNGQTLKATRFYKLALEKGSRSPSVHSNYATILMNKGQNEEAVALLKKGTEYDPLNSRLWAALARATRRLGTDEAKKEATRLSLLAQEIDPDNVDLIGLIEEALAEAGEGGAGK